MYKTQDEFRKEFTEILKEIEKLPKEEIHKILVNTKERSEFFPECKHLVLFLESLEKSKEKS